MARWPGYFGCEFLNSLLGRRIGYETIRHTLIGLKSFVSSENIGLMEIVGRSKNFTKIDLLYIVSM